jgi:hypothetical protein
MGLSPPSLGSSSIDPLSLDIEQLIFIKRAMEWERIAAAYNEDSFTSVAYSRSPNLNGFIVSVSDDGGCGEIFHRSDIWNLGVVNHPTFGTCFESGGSVYYSDLYISDNCHHDDFSYSRLGRSYGSGSGLNQYALFGQENFRVVDYEVFKIVIE